jgi:hypothetical protein
MLSAVGHFGDFALILFQHLYAFVLALKTRSLNVYKLPIEQWVESEF